MIHKKSIRFYNDREVRAVWDEFHSKWWFSAIDIVRAINDENDYVKAGNYWRWLKRKLIGDGVQLVSITHEFKFEAPDGKQRASDALDTECVQTLARHYPNNRANSFLDWFTYSDNTIDGQSKKKAYTLYDFAGQIRTKNISKGGFSFANALHFPTILPAIEKMPETTFDEIADKYVEMNVAHPFMEGNGRSTRIWLDLMLRRSLKKCIDWSRIDKNAYLNAMTRSVVDATSIKALLHSAMTDKINDRETFMKGIDYSYYYEQSES